MIIVPIVHCTRIKYENVKQKNSCVYIRLTVSRHTIFMLNNIMNLRLLNPKLSDFS